ncbi:hypothetical protein C8A01DRAFT_49054 [Parachaetomium inaequale]|uniref:Peroxin 20 n=1 Tax=Parachaetomium inaequale TaxID=2588326 RepID=A0AAN6PA76_9PEZI|nr:hypothetical protein C8A01DRAFT_49054 [Parachaetomium inaequale]
MADSMCGPSNSAKNLLAHIDRDRAHHQDRLVNAPQAGPGIAFRSQTPLANGAEMAFGGFQQGGAPMDAAFGSGLDMNTITGARAYGHPVPGIPTTTMGHGGPGAPAARLASPATGGASHQEWVHQFSGMQIGGGTAGPSAAMPTQMHQPAMAMMNPAMNMQQPSFGMGMYGGGAPAVFGFQNPGMNTAAQQQPQAAVAQESAIDVEAFNRAFGEYDDANFETELADWTEKQKVANTEFAEAQDQWMAEHGPRAEPTAEVKPPSADEMEVIDANLEKLAQEQDKRRSDDELARAAVDIVNSVADNTSEKFKNSRFFELMRRIGNREVVVEGDGFVNAATGETVSTSHDDDGHPDSGIGSDSVTPEKGAEGQRA